MFFKKCGGEVFDNEGKCVRCGWSKEQAAKKRCPTSRRTPTRKRRLTSRRQG